MKIVSFEQIEKINYIAKSDYRISGIVLMENSGVEIFRQTKALFNSLKGKNIYIFAGKGKNSGYSYVAARHLTNHGACVNVLLFDNKTMMCCNAKTNLNIIKLMGIKVLFIKTKKDLDKVKIMIRSADCIIDALFESDFQRQIYNNIFEAIKIINSAAKLVIAIDIPSGINPNTGQVSEVAVNAKYTVTFSLLKTGLLLYPGAKYAGIISIASIGIPAILLNNSSLKQNLITNDFVKSILPVRCPDAHKGNNGKVFIVGGSQGLTGAVALAGWGALKAGAGLITLGIASSLQPILSIKMTEVMTKALPELSGSISTEAIEQIIDVSKNMSVLAIGPGLGILNTTKEMVRHVVKNINIPIILDADALNAFAGKTEIIKEIRALTILTPHPGEMANLKGITPSEINKDRIKFAKESAKNWQSIIVLKGANTIIAFPNGDIYINITGNAGMATGGSGDVLTGIIAALIAQGLSSYNATIAGVYLHGYASDIISQKNKIGFTAKDIAFAVPHAIQKIFTTKNKYSKIKKIK